MARRAQLPGGPKASAKVLGVFQMKGGYLMNLTHLKYAVEVDKTRSITRAAENLSMGQPNLSRCIKELEDTLGVVLFRRTSKGITPTAQGEEFLAYARSVLAQIEEMENHFSQSRANTLDFSISVPRASYITQAFTRLVAGLDRSLHMELKYNETSSMRAVNNILQNGYNLGIIRYQSPFETNFLNLLRDKSLKSELICEFSPVVVLSADSPLARKSDLTMNDLADYIEISHDDVHVPYMPYAEVKKAELDTRTSRRIIVCERASQLDLLSSVPDTYMLSSEMPDETLARQRLVRRVCRDGKRRYRDLLIYPDGYHFSEIDNRFLSLLSEVRSQMHQHGSF